METIVASSDPYTFAARVEQMVKQGYRVKFQPSAHGTMKNAVVEWQFIAVLYLPETQH